MAIYSGFSHWKWWFSIVFCMFTRGYDYCLRKHLRVKTWKHLLRNFGWMHLLYLPGFGLVYIASGKKTSFLVEMWHIQIALSWEWVMGEKNHSSEVGNSWDTQNWYWYTVYCIPRSLDNPVTVSVPENTYHIIQTKSRKDWHFRSFDFRKCMETYPTIPKRPCSVFAPSISGHVTLFFRCLSIPIYVAEINLKSSYLRKNWNIPKPNDFREFQRIFGDSVWKIPRITYFEAIFLGCFSPQITRHGPYRWHKICTFPRSPSPRIHGSSKGRPGEGGVLRVFQVGASALTSLSWSWFFHNGIDINNHPDYYG